MTTGERIEALAKDRGISLRKLATMSDVPYTTIYSAVKRKSDRVDRSIIDKISNAFGIDARSLISENQYMSDYTADIYKKYPTVDTIDALLHDYAHQLTDQARLDLVRYAAELLQKPENVKRDYHDDLVSKLNLARGTIVIGEE